MQEVKILNFVRGIIHLLPGIYLNRTAQPSYPWNELTLIRYKML